MFSLLVSITATAQVNMDTLKLWIPGPANQDTTKFSTFYVIRPSGPVAADYWTGIFFDEYVMAQVYNETRFVIKCAKTGNLVISAGPDKNKSIININAEPGRSYYIQMNIVHESKHDVPKLSLLDEQEGTAVFNSIRNQPVPIFDPDPLQLVYGFKKIPSQYVWDYSLKTGFAELLFTPPISTRHYFASAELGYIFGYANKMLSQTFSEVDLVQRIGDIDFASQADFETYVKKNIEKFSKDLKKSETLKGRAYLNGKSRAGMTLMVYSVSEDTRPEGIKLAANQALETRTWQACMYKREVKGDKGRVFLVTFSERGLAEELHSKEEIFYKLNYLVQSSEFGKVAK
jgi:hypothetical protein